MNKSDQRHDPKADHNLRFRRQRWIESNHGVFSEIADRLGIQASFVSRVFWGFKTSHRVAEQLRDYEAPGWEEYGK